MIEDATTDFLQFQKITEITIKGKEPLYTFLEILPSLGPKELYELSLLREPRE